MESFATPEMARFAIAGVIQTFFTVVFIVGAAGIVWNRLGGVSFVITIIEKALALRFGDAAAKRISGNVEDMADRFGEWASHNTIIAALPPKGSMREAYLRELYLEEVKHIPEAIVLMEQVRIAYKPEED